jgi:2-deoxy-D-gluconate 3-dehydrogenase
MMILDDFHLGGKCGIVTGGGNGIGKGIARGLSEAGAKVLIAGRTLEKLEQTAAELNSAGLGQVVYAVVDMADPDSISSLAETALKELGYIDFLFNNAGTIHREPTEIFPREVWEKTLAVNLSGPFYLSQQVARRMIERGKGGCIVNTSSLIAVFGGKNVPAYAASKGGLTQITKTMCNDWSQYGIRVNAIGPGWVRTELTQPLFDDKEGRYKEITARIPMERWAEPEEFAGPAVFLASKASSYINGQVLFVDGGYLAM